MLITRVTTILVILCLTLGIAMNTNAQTPTNTPIAKALDQFHQAASEADGETYFGLLAENAVFIGTDGSERWTKAQFEQFASPYFAKGTGWTYHPRDRHVQLNADGKVAWFDEMLDNQSYGECRGTGVLVLTENGWKIMQYHLTIPLPNDLAKDIVQQIRAYQQ